MDIWEECPEVFHYTNIFGLKGILETQCLHATHYEYLNDSKEMIAAYPRVETLTRQAFSKSFLALTTKNPHFATVVGEAGGLDAVVEKDSKTFVRALHETTLGHRLPYRPFEPYVVSFCGHTDEYEISNGLLSQWRGYSGDAGYALVFDTEKLAEFLKSESKKFLYSPLQFGSVVYDGDDKKFDEEFSELVETLEAVCADFPTSLTEENLNKLYGPFISSISRFKHRGFQEEKEVRIVASPMSSTFVEHMMNGNEDFKKAHAGKQTKERKARANLASYIELAHDSKKLPIKRIIVGPYPAQPIIKSRLEKFIEFLGLHCDIHCSETPFVRSV